MSEVTSSIENSLMVITDVEILREHYARTLAAWYRRFNAESAAIKARHGEYFYRLWEFYLTICEISFKHSDLVVFQIQLAKTNNTLPINRDYMHTETTGTHLKPDPSIPGFKLLNMIRKPGNNVKEPDKPKSVESPVENQATKTGSAPKLSLRAQRSNPVL